MSSRSIFCFALAMLFALSSTAEARCQPKKSALAPNIELRVMHAIHEPEESSVSYVTVAVKVRSAGSPLVIPNCSDSSDKKIFCFATLRRANGRFVSVRRGLMATLGADDTNNWKSVDVRSDNYVEFEVSIDMGLLNAHPGESVRIAFGAWPEEEPTKDSKHLQTVLTPAFRIPVMPE